jgi:hypothetical protein
MKVFEIKFIRVFLILVSVHSIAVGINLISFPPSWMASFGFLPITENFFKVQGGVFHIVMAVAYTLAAWRPVEYSILIIFSIIAKFIATIFLVSYFLLVQGTVTVLLSGIVDLIMGTTLCFLYLNTNLNK